MELTQEQQKIIFELQNWIKSMTNESDDEWIEVDKQFITIGGFAGTGKTTLISHFRKILKEKYPKIKVAFCAYTGKATRVLKNKLEEAGAIYSTDSISTIQGLIYNTIEDAQDRIIGWERKEEIKEDLIIIDEASMVDQNIWEDITSYHVPIIAIGDHGQLPPINGNFNLMEKPQYSLIEIHRQAKDNPIIKLSIHARNFGQIIPSNYSDTVIKVKKSDPDMGYRVEEIMERYDRDTLIICGYNHTRIKLNKYIRQKIGMESELPIPGDRLICLRNNHEAGIYNGMFGELLHIEDKDERRYKVEIRIEDTGEIYSGNILKVQFNNQQSLNFSENRRLTLDSDLFDFGYAVTVHKSQGGQAKRVIFFEEHMSKMDFDTKRRWLYTAVTRAQEELYIIE